MFTLPSRKIFFLKLLNRPANVLIMCIFISLFFCCLIALSPLSSDGCQCENYKHKSNVKHVQLRSEPPQLLQRGPHKLAVLVPYRDRFEELLRFIPYMNKFLSHQNINFKIFILNQIDNYRFNRASLINVGFLKSQAECDYIAMHDVDLLPINQELSYQYPKKRGPFHIASPELHPRYHYTTFVGGILLIRREDFLLVDGMSNKYWGWGLEDDEFYVRLKEAGLNVSRPVNISTGSNNTFLHIHDRVRRKRDMAKCFNQKEVTRRRDKQTGLHNVKYSIEEIKEITVDGASADILNIRLSCDRELTPWCSCDADKAVPKLSESQIPKAGSVIVPNVKKTVRGVNKKRKK
ncbi:Beta-1,4-galactosyltransferase 7 [Frankliniella fusca]|uniref:Beta-1,4-N-acetylgalactosaminyltransferase n=1 Tax=Frankliniella fusca TaxID=407009 RepID=A0AAE1LIX5_9NEOP|nr:Beta-1,4-galactosyltransferase 7 [Frankliniella fusca]